MKLKDACSLGRKAMINLDNIKEQRHYFTDKGPYSQSYGLSSSHVWMWKLNYKESLVPKNWSFWTEVLEKTLESPLDSKEIKPFNPKGNQLWVFIERLMPKLKLQYFGHMMWRALLGKDPELGKLREGGERDHRGWDGWMASSIYSMDMSLSKLWEILQDCEAWHAAVHGVTKSLTWLSI